MSKAQAAIDFANMAAGLPAVFAGIAKEAQEREERVGALRELIQVQMLKVGAKLAAESVGPAQDFQNVDPAVAVATTPVKTLAQTMNTPDVQSWLDKSVSGTARRAGLPYVFARPGVPPQTNMDRAKMMELLQQLLAAPQT